MRLNALPAHRGLTLWQAYLSWPEEGWRSATGKRPVMSGPRWPVSDPARSDPVRRGAGFKYRNCIRTRWHLRRASPTDYHLVVFHSPLRWVSPLLLLTARTTAFSRNIIP